MLIAFERPKGHRRSYKQWCEGSTAPQMVFEILSPSHTATEMTKKRRFYEQYGVEEDYIYDPDEGTLEGYLRTGDHLSLLPEMNGWISPRTGVKLEIVNKQLVCTRPDGKAFETYFELLVRAEEERQRADQERRRAETESRRADRLAAKLRELGIDPSSLCLRI